MSPPTTQASGERKTTHRVVYGKDTHANAQREREKEVLTPNNSTQKSLNTSIDDRLSFSIYLSTLSIYLCLSL